MLYTIVAFDKRKEGWAIATLREAIENGATTADVSISKTDKDGGIAFPGFDSFAQGVQVEGNLWTNPTSGRKALYPNREKKTVARTAPTGIKAAQERKAEFIEKAQDTKAAGIKVASAMRDATLLALEEIRGMTFEFPGEKAETLQHLVEKWKAWYLAQWNRTEKEVDVPFN